MVACILLQPTYRCCTRHIWEKGGVCKRAKWWSHVWEKRELPQSDGYPTHRHQLNCFGFTWRPVRQFSLEFAFRADFPTGPMFGQSKCLSHITLCLSWRKPNVHSCWRPSSQLSLSIAAPFFCDRSWDRHILRDFCQFSQTMWTLIYFSHECVWDSILTSCCQKCVSLRLRCLLMIGTHRTLKKVPTVLFLYSALCTVLFQDVKVCFVFRTFVFLPKNTCVCRKEMKVKLNFLEQWKQMGYIVAYTKAPFRRH